jgi:serine/threonine-protein kinase
VSSAVWFIARTPTTPPRVSRLQIVPEGAEALSPGGVGSNVTITPDGSRIVYIGNGGTQLFVRPVDALEPIVLTRGDLRDPFVSPDGQWVGFFDGGNTLRKIAITGGPATTVFNSNNPFRGATWTPAGDIIFSTIDASAGLRRLGPAGGSPMVLTRPDQEHGEQNHWFPTLLPNGRGVLFTIWSKGGGLDSAEVAVLDLRTGASKVLVRGGSDARYVSGGYLTFAAAGGLRAVRFSLEALAVDGPPVTVVPRVSSTPWGVADAAVSSDGTLVYAPSGSGVGVGRSLAWIDRQGHRTLLSFPERTYAYPRLSPDGSRIVVVSLDDDYDLWLCDVRRATLTRLTFDPGLDSFPAWTPDGKQIVFTSSRDGAQKLYWQAADATDPAERLTECTGRCQDSSVSADGTRVIFSDAGASSTFDVMSMRLDGTRRVEPLVATRAAERNGELSPDGRWLAYQSDESGQLEIYVRPFPAVDSARWKISTGGGTRPLWAHTGQELFYLTLNGALMRVGVERGATWRASVPTKLFERQSPSTTLYGGRTYDISRDDQQFLMVVSATGPDPTTGPRGMVVVQHWEEELKRLVPAK